MIAWHEMTLEQEQVYLMTQAQLISMQRELHQKFESWCLGGTPTEEYVQELVLMNTRIDLCLEAMYDAGIYTKEDLERLHYGQSDQEIADEAGINVDVLTNARAALKESGKLPK